MRWKPRLVELALLPSLRLLNWGRQEFVQLPVAVALASQQQQRALEQQAPSMQTPRLLTPLPQAPLVRVPSLWVPLRAPSLRAAEALLLRAADEPPLLAQLLALVLRAQPENLPPSLRAQPLEALPLRVEVPTPRMMKASRAPAPPVRP